MTHLVLMKGHLWEKRDVVLPVSAVDKVDEEGVYLALDLQGVEALPAIPVQRAWREVDPRRGTLFGAVTGGLLGLLGGPVGEVVGAAAGAVPGRVAAGHIDMGFSDEKLTMLQDRLQPESSALVLLIENRWVETILAAQAEWDGRLAHHRLTDEVVTQILDQIEP